MKRRLVKLSVLHLPNNKGRFHLYSDTSKCATGNALYQIQNSKPKLISYVFKRPPEALRNYSITKLQMCGLAINIASFVHLLKRVDFNTIVDHLALTHIIKSEAEPTITRIKRLLEVIHSYSFNLYYVKGKDMMISDFLARQKHDKCNPHDIIPISFNMQNILHTIYNNIGVREEKKYLIQPRSQTEISGIILPEVHGIDKGIYPNIMSEKQVIKWVISSEAKGISQVKLRLGQGRVGIKQKMFKFLISQPLDKPEQSTLVPGRRPMIQIAERPIPSKTRSKFSTPQSSGHYDKVIPVPDYTIPQTMFEHDLISRTIRYTGMLV